ncbi:MAG TPA: hypothetical protein VFQ18_05755 [Candidatus Acidoferrum sp.]|jgi:hypothetical protein|nr:hypothetical protein [Candidatus Acidoferrum sp.]
MRQSAQPGAAIRNSSWHAGLCLFLAILFLYNPFFTVYGSPAGLNVRHPLSLRGTVASSELRRGIIKQTAPKIDAPTEAALEVVPLPKVFPLDAASTQEEPLIPEKETALEDLWCRPPPVL